MASQCEVKNCSRNILLDGQCMYHLKQTCPVCMDKIGSINTSTVKRLPCGHSIHIRCLLGCIRNSSLCPVCRSDLEKEPLVQFKLAVEQDMRELYSEAIRSLQGEV